MEWVINLNFWRRKKSESKLVGGIVRIGGKIGRGRRADKREQENG